MLFKDRREEASPIRKEGGQILRLAAFCLFYTGFTRVEIQEEHDWFHPRQTVNS